MSVTLKDIKEYYKSVFVLDDQDDCIIDAILAVAVAVNTKSDPVWLFILGAPSGGKSELVITCNDVFKAFNISTMTENTLMSGMRATAGKENSLLKQIGKNGLIIMKDYTSILSMDHAKRDTIIAQFREVFDGEFTKRTGNGTGGNWRGKVNMLAGVTDALFTCDGEGAELGRRALNYCLREMNDDERMGMMEQSNKNMNDIGVKRQKIRDMVKEFVADKIKDLPEDGLPTVEKGFAREIMELANFLTRARTATKRNFQGKLTAVMWAELPMRANNQLQLLAQMLQWLNNGKIIAKHKHCIYKIALDSIPKQRRQTLSVLARYDLVTTKGYAQEIGFPSAEARNFLEDLNVLGIIDRSVGGALHNKQADCWTIKDKYREIILKYDKGIERKEGQQLEGNDDLEDGGGGYIGSDPMNYDPETIAEIERKDKEFLDSFETPEAPSLPW